MPTNTLHSSPHHLSTHTSGIHWRTANAASLAAGLVAVREKTLALFDVYANANQLDIPLRDELNPPLWELGHIAWFQEHWIARNPTRHLGIAYDATQTRPPSVVANADAWYDSSQVAHNTRWHLPYLNVDACKAYLTETLSQTLALLREAQQSDAALYFFRLVLFHEAMHVEAALYMAQSLGIELNRCTINLPNATDLIAPKAINMPHTAQINIKKQSFIMGYSDVGFAFDNELNSHELELPAYEIDAQCVTWQDYLAFVEDTQHELPRHMRRVATGHEVSLWGNWLPVDTQAPAVHVTYHEALRYCQWAKRRLPTEAEWELAASLYDESHFVWGSVWEWTSSAFAPYAGFTPHPYRDYSAPWFHNHQVLRGASHATLPIMRHTRYRNFYLPERNDIFVGFRTCAL